MQSSFFLSSFVPALLVYGALDAVYFYFRLPALRETYARVQRSPSDVVEFRFFPAGVLNYLLLAAALVYFSIGPARREEEEGGSGVLRSGAARALVLALAVYGTYNLTSYATLTRYPAAAATADTLWGAFAFVVTSVAVLAWLRGGIEDV